MAKKTTAAPESAPLADNISSLQLNLDDPPKSPESPAPSPEPAPAPSPTPEPAAEVIPQGAGRDEPPANRAASMMRQWGFEVDDDTTDDDVRDHFESVQTKADKFDSLEREHAALQQRLAQFETDRNRPAATPEPTPAAKTPPATAPEAVDDLGIPERPAFDEVNLAILKIASQAGKVVEAPGGLVTSEDSSYRAHCDAYNQQLLAIRKYDAEWTPRKVAEHLDRRSQANSAKFVEEAKRQALEETRREQAEREQKEFFDAYSEKNAKWLYTPDQTQFTEDGKLFAAELEEQLSHGISREKAIKNAKAIVKAETGRAAWDEQPAPVQDEPSKKVMKFRSRLNNNGKEALQPSPPPVSRPEAAARARSTNGMTHDQKLTSAFSSLMSAKVADRM